MKKKLVYLALMLIAATVAQVKAQVTIGGTDNPKPGALLDLNSSTKGGLLLSNVSLTDLGKIPANVFTGITSEQDVNTDLAGTMVYNTNPTTGVGVYVWNGNGWKSLASVPNPCPSFVQDAEENIYTVGYFGAAGCWMTQNLRYIPNPDDGYFDYYLSAPDYYKCYYYPNMEESLFKAHPEWGLLYNWAAATNGKYNPIDEGDTDHEPVPGICPIGWHLPSNKEWSELTDVINNDATGAYSTLMETGSTGTKMKSTVFVNATDSNGASKPADEGGFDGLLVGYLLSNGESRGFGTSTIFWSSSSSSSINPYAWGWGLGDSGDWVGNDFDNLTENMYSVRCKQD
jgi:uncharacterized protein (TIGR02145 family)